MVTIWFKDSSYFGETMHVQVSNLIIARHVWDKLTAAGFEMLASRP